jgi:hypothetical protein
MKRVAVFLDAGYFWVQLCNILLGTYTVRTQVDVDYDALRKLMLAEVHKQFGADCHFLRVYWYDGPGTGGKTHEHHAIDKLDDFKLRLGTRNGTGTQKGVDGLIIADLISLTQQRAITHALLITGDSDITPGVIAAQGMGLRAHLLSLGSSAATSPYLAAEADLKRSWGQAEAALFAKANTAVPAKLVSSQPKPAKAATQKSSPPATGAAPTPQAPAAVVKPASRATASKRSNAAPTPVAAAVDSKVQKVALTEAALQDIAKKAKEESQAEPQVHDLPPMPASDAKMLPRDIDIFLLTIARRTVGRSLEESEKRMLRDEFRKLL